MANSCCCTSLLMAIYLLLIIIFTTTTTTKTSKGEFELNWVHHLAKPSSKEGCHGSIAECMAGTHDSDEQEELSMDSEIILVATKTYISYEALRRNSVPCSHRGASYYNCKPGAEANPYNRGCTAITRCRG